MRCLASHVRREKRVRQAAQRAVRGQGLLLVDIERRRAQTTRLARYPLRQLEKGETDVHRDITLTKRWMDALSVDIAILFPTPMLNLGLHPQIEVEVALSRAYNRWLTEKILPRDRRIRSMLYLPFNDPEAAYEMAREFAGREGVLGFMVTATRNRAVHNDAYMKTYAFLEAANLPLGFHASYNWNDQTMAMIHQSQDTL